MIRLRRLRFSGYRPGVEVRVLETRTELIRGQRYSQSINCKRHRSYAFWGDVVGKGKGFAKEARRRPMPPVRVSMRRLNLFQLDAQEYQEQAK